MLRSLTLVAALSALPFALSQDPGPAVPPVSGVVVDANGQPLAGVRYWVSGHEQLEGGTWVVTFYSGMPRMRTTGPDGVFEVPGRTDLRYDVDFDAEGYAPAFAQALEPGSRTTITMRRGSTVAGRAVQLTDSGERPLEHVRVAMRKPNGRGLWFESERSTEADGRFAFEGFLDGSVTTSPASGWQLICAGAQLPIELERDGDVDDVRIEIRMSRERR